MKPAWGMVLGALAFAAAPGATKQGRTYYTPERIAGGQENVARYAWAQRILERIHKGDPYTYVIGREYIAAPEYAALDDERIWLLQPTTRLPRVLPVETQALCPVHGDAVRRYNAFHPWRIDPIEHPYQVRCPVGGEWYPSNRYDLGDLTSGEFPDDGNGILVDGRRYYLLREYAHGAYCGVTIPALRSFSQAWLLTGDDRYAHKGCVLLARLASEYPNFTDRADRLYLAPYGGTHPSYSWKHGGMITDLIWETFCLEATAYAYDALYPYFDQDPDLLAFLRAKGLPAESGAAIRGYIEEQLFRPAAEGLLNGAIRGNEGFHQAAALAVALVLDDYSDRHPNSADLVDEAYHGAGHAAWLLVNGLRTDGSGHESPNYNRIKTDFIRVARLMEEVRRRQPERFPPERYPDLFGDRKALALFDSFIDLQVLDAFLPPIGDCGGSLEPRHVPRRAWSLLTSENLYAFQRTGDPRYARASVDMSGEPFTGELFEPFPADAIRDALARPESEIRRAPRLLDGYGVGILESGEGDFGRAVVLNYSILLGHWQADPLLLCLYANGVDCLPDLGYPFSWDYRWQWDANQLAHNTVTIDETQQEMRRRNGGRCRLMASAEGVHVLTASQDPYTPADNPARPTFGTDLFERTVVLVELDERRFYVVDLFVVRGGRQHDQSWHGPRVLPTAPPLEWSALPGTLAGPEVAQFGKWTDAWGRERDDFPSYLIDLRRAEVTEPAVWSWPTGLSQVSDVRLHVVPVDGPLVAYLGHGRSPARPREWFMPYLILRRTGPPPLATRFVTVLDAACGEPTVRAVRLTGREPLSVEIDHDGGTDSVTLAVPLQDGRGTAPREIGIEVRTTGRRVRIGGPDPGYLTSTITDADPERHTITVAHDPALAAELKRGRYVRVYNTDRSAMLRIESVAPSPEGLAITFAGSALVARGPVVDVADGRLTLGAYLLYGESRADEAGRLSTPREADPLAGCRLGTEPDAPTVAGVQRGEQSLVWLDGDLPAEALRGRYLGRVVSLWQYGVGDQIEVARLRVAD